MTTYLIIAGIIVGIGVLILGFSIARFQNEAIADCLNRKRRHDKILTGDLDVCRISDSELVSLCRPLLTHIGMGGIGPCYNPSFIVYCLLVDELTDRRSKKLLLLR